jgi:two-component system phosphate regulon sensor histidine kinase PhoR
MLSDPLVSEVFERRPRSSRAIALFVAATVVTVGIMWVVITDILTYHLLTDRTMLARVQTVIDCVFILLAGVALYFVARKGATHLSRAHRMLVAILDSIGDGLIVLGPDRKIVYTNRAAQEMLGCTDGDDLVGVGGPEFAQRFKVSRQDGTLLPADRFVSQRVFDEPGPIHTKEVLYPPGRNRELAILATGAPVVVDDDQRPRLVVSVMHDITDNERFEAMRDQFMSAAAHYLKTPVAIVKANVQYLARKAAPDELSSLAMMQRQCARIDRLVQNLLVLARARSRSLELHARDMELAPLVRAMATDLGNPQTPRQVKIDIAALPHVRGDHERLSIVAHNLSDDALQHSQPNSTIHVNLDVTDHEAEIRVTYTPLPPTGQPFAGALEYDDTALSRSVTETIIEAHGGHTGQTVGDKEASTWVTLPVIGGPA